MLTTTMKAMMSHVAPVGYGKDATTDKITIVGAGTVGTSIAFALLSMGLVKDLVMVDKNETIVRRELLDIQHGLMYIGSPKVTATSDFGKCVNSVVCIITIGASSEDSRETAANINTGLYRDFVPMLSKVCPDAILLIVSHPVEVMTYVAWRLSNFQAFKVIGFGTILESSMLKQLIANKMECSIKNVQAFIAGEQASNGIPLWSSATVSGVRLRDVNADLGTANDPEGWGDLHKQVIKTRNDVGQLKVCRSWGTAISVARIVKAILEDTKECFSVSVHMKGCRHGMAKDIFISLPCIIGRNGISYRIRQNLSEDEKSMLQKAADSIYDLQTNIELYEPKQPEVDLGDGEPFEDEFDTENN